MAAISVDTHPKQPGDLPRHWDVHLPLARRPPARATPASFTGPPGQEALLRLRRYHPVPRVHKDYRTFSMTVRNLLFGNFPPKPAWAARSESTLFRFEAEEVVFADNGWCPASSIPWTGGLFWRTAPASRFPLGGQIEPGVHPGGSGVPSASAAMASGADLLGFDFYHHLFHLRGPFRRWRCR